jgi:hypothetical protein
MSSNRPAGITLIAAYYLITGLISLVAGLFGSVFGTLIICFGAGLLANGIWSLINGILNLVLGASAWSGKDWARTVIMLLALLGIVVNVINILTAGIMFYPALSAVINALVFLYMQSDEAKHFFATH